MSPERKQTLRRLGLFAAVGLVAYAISLTLFFPYQRAKELAQAMAAAQGWDMNVADVGPTWNFGLRLSGITMASHEEKPGTKVVRFTVEEARVAFGLAMFFGTSTDIKASVDAFGGRIDFAQQRKGRNGPFHIDLKVDNVKLEELPGIREAINMPFSGRLALEASLGSDTGKNADMQGAASFTCSACVAGDGKTPFKIASNPFLAGGLALPRLRLGDLVGHVAVEKGTAKLDGVQAKSPDGELTLDGEVVLRDPTNLSSLNLYLRFKLLPPFLKLAPAVDTVLQMAGSAGKRPDGFYGLRIYGTFASVGTAFSTVSPVVPPPRTPSRPGGASLTPSVVPAAPSIPSPSPPPPPAPEPAAPSPAPSPPPPGVMASSPPPPSPPPPPDPVPAPPPGEAAPPPSAVNTAPVVRGVPSPVVAGPAAPPGKTDSDARPAAPADPAAPSSPEQLAAQPPSASPPPSPSASSPPSPSDEPPPPGPPPPGAMPPGTNGPPSGPSPSPPTPPTPASPPAPAEPPSHP